MSLRSPQARSLGRAIQRAREDAGVGVRELARRLGKVKNASFVTRLERGEVLITSELLIKVAEALGVGAEQLSRWLDSASALGMSTWTPSVGTPEQLSTLMDYEREAVRITECAHFPPGLVQTEETARAIISEDDDAHNVAELVQTRVSRRSVLTGRNPVIYTLFLEESALRWPIAGAEALVEQIDFLTELSRRDNITVRVLPTAIGAYFGMVSPFTLLEFDETDPIVYLERLRTGTWLVRRNETEIYFDAVDKFESKALSEDESRDLFQKYRAEWSGGKE